MTDFNTTIESATTFILDASLRTTFVLLVTILAGWSLHSASASSRRLVWIGGLTASLMIPVMMATGPSIPITFLSETTIHQEAATIDQTQSAEPPIATSRQANLAMTKEAASPGENVTGEDFEKSVGNEIAQPLLAGPSALTLAARQRRTHEARSTRSWGLGWQSLMGVALLLGIVTRLARLVAGNLRVHDLVRKSANAPPQKWTLDWNKAKATMQVGDAVLLKESTADISPLACGVLRRTVLLPMAARDWENDRLRAVMLHELGHVRQRDVAAILLGQLAVAVFFFHPLVWFVVHRLRHDCERACDDLVLNAGQKPVDYARHLTEIAHSFSASRHQNALAMAMSQSSNIESRVTAILDVDIPRQSLSNLARRFAMAGALLLGALIAAPRAGHSQTASDGTSPSSRSTGTEQARSEVANAPSGSTQKLPQPHSPRTDNNSVFTANEAPKSWNVNTGENILWSSKLGSQVLGSPVVSGNKIFVGTNNAGNYLGQQSEPVDLGCLLTFDTQTGKFLWQYSAEKLSTGRVNDWPMRGISASPFVDGNRLWIVTNRSEVVCMDTEGFHDGEDDGLLDGPNSESLKAGNSQAKKRADVVWTVDLMKTFGSFPHNHSDCTITSDGRLLFIVVPNGTDHTHRNLPSPEAPSFVALDAKSGAVVWSNRDSENDILHGQWSSAAYGQFEGVSQVICPSGSGWLFGLDAATGKTLWKFDCNPKDSKWILGSKGRRNNLIAKPLICDGRIYMATGQDPEHGEGNADLWCIDPTKRGDVSPQVVNRSQFVQNQNSAVVWHFDQEEFTPNDEPVFEYFFHRSISTPVAKDGLLIAADTAGLIHCFDMKTGKRHWTHDLFAACWSSPIIINDRVYVGDEDGEVVILELSKQKKLIAEINMKEAITTTPTVADDVLYVATRSRLFAIKPGATPVDDDTTAKVRVDQLMRQQQDLAALQLLSRKIAVLTAALDSTRKRESQIAADRKKLQQQTVALELRLKALKQAADAAIEN